MLVCYAPPPTCAQGVQIVGFRGKSRGFASLGLFRVCDLRTRMQQYLGPKDYELVLLNLFFHWAHSLSHPKTLAASVIVLSLVLVRRIVNLFYPSFIFCLLTFFWFCMLCTYVHSFDLLHRLYNNLKAYFYICFRD